MVTFSTHFCVLLIKRNSATVGGIVVGVGDLVVGVGRGRRRATPRVLCLVRVLL